MARTPSLLGILGLLLLPSAAVAQDQAEPDRGTRIIMEEDDGSARLLLNGVAEEPEEPGEGFSLGVRGRYTTVPDAVFERFLLDFSSYDAYSVGLELGIDGPAGSRVIFGIDYTDLRMAPGNFRNEKDTPPKASYTEVDLHMVALDVLFLWRLKLAEPVGFVYGVGLGVAYTPGTITSVDVLPNCTHPVADCAHWNEVTKREQDLPTRWWPLLTLQAGLYWDPVPGFRLRFEAGFRDVIFAGISGRSTF